jgi:hypothetical protein
MSLLFGALLHVKEGFAWLPLIASHMELYALFVIQHNAAFYR